MVTHTHGEWPPIRMMKDSLRPNAGERQRSGLFSFTMCGPRANSKGGIPMGKWMHGRRLGGVLSGLIMTGLIGVFSIAGGLGAAKDTHVITIGPKNDRGAGDHDKASGGGDHDGDANQQGGSGEGEDEHDNGRPKISE